MKNIAILEGTWPGRYFSFIHNPHDGVEFGIIIQFNMQTREKDKHTEKTE